MEKSFKILTFNAGLLGFLSKDIVPYVDERVEHICSELEKIDADIICLQEVFSKKHFEMIKNTLKKFPHHKKSKAKNIFLPPGLCIFSKFPIIKSHFQRFFDHQDIEKFSNHGFETSTILINNSPVEIVNVHLTSGGFTGNLETKQVARTAFRQARQILQTEKLQNTILIGDFNCGPRTDTEVYKEFLDNNFSDPLGNFPIEENVTWDNQNSLVAKQNFEMPTDRIDHVFLSKNFSSNFLGHQICLNKNFPTIPYNLSDHYGIKMEIISNF